MSRILDQPPDIVEQVKFTPKSLRPDLADGKVSIGWLNSAAASRSGTPSGSRQGWRARSRTQRRKREAREAQT
jgi:hypothetical protein